jgi:NADPH:quinone reductase-like Zn-dependent oxidoreductase
LWDSHSARSSTPRITETFIVLTGLIESGTVIPVVDRRYPLSEAPKAIQYPVDGHARGKLVITLP